MRLTQEEIQGIKDQATCFSHNIWGSDLQTLCPAAVVAQMRGAKLMEAYNNTAIIPHNVQSGEMLKQALCDVARTMGFETASQYLNMLMEEGQDILQRLPEVPHA